MIVAVDWQGSIETERSQPARVISSDYRTGKVILRVVQYETTWGSMISLYEEDGTPWGNGPKLRNCPANKESES
jgi:hypothetical protein